MTHHSRRAVLVLAVLAALTAGCSDRTSGKNKPPTPAPDPAAAAADRARTYMRAVVADDWITACNLMAADERAACHGRHPTPEPADPSGPAIGPALLDRPPTRVPATSAHPAGWGVITTHTVTWPGKRTRTSYTAVRMTESGGLWWVEQRQDVSDAELTRAVDPAAAALSRRVR